MKTPYITFGLAALGAVVGALATLDWSQVLSAQNAGVVALVLSGVGATIKAYLTPSPKQQEQGE